MNSLWNDEEAKLFEGDPKKLRIYTSRLLGKNDELVLHGGGNTSVKLTETDFFGDPVDLLFVKGSGWDLATIESEGFTPLRMTELLKLAQLPTLSDTDMVNQQRVAMLDADAPNASVEAILHAIIPFRFVDHTHADSILAITNTADGEQRIKKLFPNRTLIVPYVMPGFVLAKKIIEMTSSIDWNSIDAMVLMNHGLFTFNNDARRSYELTIEYVSKAENYLESRKANDFAKVRTVKSRPLSKLAQLRKIICESRQQTVVTHWNQTDDAIGFSQLSNVSQIATRGPATPDHSIRTKRIPMILEGEVQSCVDNFVTKYKEYFKQNNSGNLVCLEPTPRWVVWPDYGIVSIGTSPDEAVVIGDIADHTIKVIQQAEAIGGWQALPSKDVFDVEYWELEQAKLKTGKPADPLQGKIALVTGAANGIGRSTARLLACRGACVLAADVNPNVESIDNGSNIIGQLCDVTDRAQLVRAVETCVQTFGGLDIVVSNAGAFTQGRSIAEVGLEDWQQSLDLNLNQHKNLMQIAYPYLKLGIEPTFIVIGTKNVAAPGPGASAYSVAKAGLNQLARVAALEWGQDRIRVNVVHPDAVYDTGLWSDEILQQRADHYGLTVEQYKSRNVLCREITAEEVGRLISDLAGPNFLKTTGAQIPIDGGNNRVI